MNVAFVQHAEHDIHGDHRCDDQQQRVGQRRLKCERGTLKAGLDTGRQVEGFFLCLDRFNRFTERHTGWQVERNGHRRKLRHVIDRERSQALGDARHRRQRHLNAARTGHIDAVQALHADLEAWLDFEHHTVLV